VSDPTTLSRAARLWIVLSLNIGLVGGLVVVGIGAHSLGVLAEAADYVGDAAAIGVSILAIWLSGLPPTKRRPHGYQNATAWAALVNGGWLLLLTALVSAAAVHRLVSGTREVHGLPVLIVSSIAAAVMVLGALILAGDEDDGDRGGNLNVRAVLLDTAADAATAAAVAITGAIILATNGNYWLDPAVALAVSAVIAYHAVQLLRRVAVVLHS
jgi:cobalt-zinc-cadmium efflux system protein